MQLPSERNGIALDWPRVIRLALASVEDQLYEMCEDFKPEADDDYECDDDDWDDDEDD